MTVLTGASRRSRKRAKTCAKRANRRSGSTSWGSLVRASTAHFSLAPLRDAGFARVALAFLLGPRPLGADWLAGLGALLCRLRSAARPSRAAGGLLQS